MGSHSANIHSQYVRPVIDNLQTMRLPGNYSPPKNPLSTGCISIICSLPMAS